MEVLKHHLSF